MILGFDIDGCLTNQEESDRIRLIEFCNSRSIDLKEGFLWKDHFGLSDKDYQDYMNIHFPKMVNHIKPRSNTSAALHRLKRDGHKIIIISARDEFRDRENEPYKGWMMRQDTINWFSNNDIPYDKMIFSSCNGNNNKGIICKENHVDIMLEDSVDNINDIVTENIRCIVMDNSNNKFLSHPYIYHVDSMIKYYITISKLNRGENPTTGQYPFAY